jgi:Gas vesicle protein G
MSFPLLSALAGVRLVRWLATTVAAEAERQYLDEGPIRGELLELLERYDEGEFSVEEYDERERVLLEHLDAIRAMKAEREDQQE